VLGQMASLLLFLTVPQGIEIPDAVSAALREIGAI
jgi:hypothetical protein